MRAVTVLALLTRALSAQAEGPIPLEAKPTATRVGGPLVQIAFDVPSGDVSEMRCLSSIGTIKGPVLTGAGKGVCKLKPPQKGPNEVAIVVVYSTKTNGPMGTTFVNVKGRGDADYPRAILFTRPTIVPSDGVSTVEINLFALDRSGEPFGAELSHVTASGGQVGPLRAAGVGRAVASLTVPSSGDSVDIEARLPDGGNRVNAQYRLTLTPAAPSLVSMVGPHKTVNPGEPITVSVTLSSDGGGPAAGSVKLHTDSGRNLAPIESGPGTYTATFPSPPTMPESGSVTVYATVIPMPGVQGKTLQASIRIPLGPQPEAPPEFVAAPTPAPKKEAKGLLRAAFDPDLRARGQHVKRIGFKLLDQDGDPWTPDDVEAAADIGKVLGISKDGNRFVVDYEAPDIDSGQASLTVTIAGKKVDGSGLVSISRATGSIGLSGALLVGGLTNFGSITAVDFEIVAMYSVRQLSGLRVGAFIGIAPTGSQVSSGCPDALSVPASSVTGNPGCPSQSGVPASKTGLAKEGVAVRGTPIAVRADWTFPLGQADVYVGGSLGVMVVSGSAPGTAGATAGFVTPAFYKALYGGLVYPFGPGAVNAEVRWSDARFDGGNSQIEVLGNMGGPMALVGYQMNF
jgi:hypothetical protein